MSSILIQSLMPALSPMLNQLSGAMESIDKEHGVKDTMIIIGRKYNADGTSKPVLRYMHIDANGVMRPILDKVTQKPMVFGMDQIINLISGPNSEQDQD